MNILLVEDNELIREGIIYFLENESFNVFSAESYEETLEIMNYEKYDLAILDVGLPDGDGFELGNTIKNKLNIPVVFLTAKDQDEDIDKGLVIADDYIIKPFRNRELLLRINNLLNRKSSNTIKINNYEIDLDKCIVKKDREVINLSALEFKLLVLFVNNKNKVLSLDYLLNFIYDITGNYVNDNTLRVYIKRIREKLNDDNLIKTVKGIGYRLDEE